MKRLFAACKIHPDKLFLEQYKQLRLDFRQQKINWVKPENLHITLKFFGETPEDKIQEIIRNLQDSLAEHKPFSVELKNIGVFGSKYNPRVLWVGMQNAGKFLQLMENMHTNLEKIAYMRDRQNLVAHLTLGRIKQVTDKIAFQKTISKYRHCFDHKEFISSVCLFESITHASGPVYKAIEIIPLQA